MQLANHSQSCLGAHYTHNYHSGIWLLYRCGGALLQYTFFSDLHSCKDQQSCRQQSHTCLEWSPFQSRNECHE